jgi:hypothetical protein
LAGIYRTRMWLSVCKQALNVSGPEQIKQNQINKELHRLTKGRFNFS